MGDDSSFTRRCRGCSAPLDVAPGDTGTRYCAACRADACGYCGQFAGRHKPRCRRGLHTPRPAAPVYGCVSMETLTVLYTAYRPGALRAARALCGAEAEDAVQDAALALLRRLDTLRALTPTYFLQAVAFAALERGRCAWRRHVVALPPEGLHALEHLDARAVATR